MIRMRSHAPTLFQRTHGLLQAMTDATLVTDVVDRVAIHRLTAVHG